MKIRCRFLIHFVLLFLFCCGSAAASTIIELNNNWSFRKVGDSTWLPATVPGTVYTDLLANKIIPNPFFGDNEKGLQWIDTCSWEYIGLLNINEEILSHQNSELIFTGLDTYADVFINDNLVLTAENMFVEWMIPSKHLLHVGENKIHIIFHPAIKKGKELSKKVPYDLPGEERSFTRKAAFQYGWDFGPRFVNCGIWKPVMLRTWDNFRIDNLQVEQKQLNDTFAILNFKVKLKSIISFNSHLKLINQNNNQVVYKDKIIHPIDDTIVFEYKIYNPKRWWCNGYGEPYLYSFQLLAADEHGVIQDSVSVKIGLRTIEIKQVADQTGKSFSIVLNNVPVFMKGANYIPMDIFLSRVPENRTEYLLNDVVDCHMNMIRVWGGGVYESDKFYEKCDEKGILVWQDFMFAGTMYPGDSGFIENVKIEIKQNIVRLRNHPCLALWCGNNEIDEGWNNWGWQKQYNYSMDDSVKIWSDYDNLFQFIIPTLVNRQDHGRFYWPSSPSIGWGRSKSLTHGDSHYWGVWWGEEPFEIYTEKVGRFMSEYGFQGMPSPATILDFADADKLDTSSASIRNHEKHTTGFKIINDYLKRDYPEPKTFSQFVYYSQLLQARGIEKAISAHRSAKPFCMGTLYWQLNDCWPGITWSSRDYFGRWKALQYAVKKAFRTVSIATNIEKNQVTVRIISDSLADINAYLDLQLMTFGGKVLWSQKADIRIHSNYSEIVFGIDTARLIRKADPAKIVFVARVYSGKKLLDENLFYFRKPLLLKLDQPRVEIDFDKDNSVIKIISKTLIKNFYLQVDGNDQLSDNYFDVLPGREYLIQVPGFPESHKLGNINFQSLNRNK